jgi:hypothetical protein
VSELSAPRTEVAAIGDETVAGMRTK